MPLGDVEHGNINRLATGLADGFDAGRLEPAFVDYREAAEAPWPHLNALIESNRVRALMTMNGVGFPIGGHEVLVERSIRLFVFGTDHPCHLYPVMEAAPPGAILSFPTASNLTFAGNRMRDDLAYLHVAHAATPRAVRPWAERDIPVLMVGNLRQSAADQVDVWATRGAETPVLEAMRDIYLNGGGETLEAIGEAALAETGAQAGPLAEDRAFAKVLRYFDPFARCRLRETVLQAVADQPVTVAGDWAGLRTMLGGRCQLIGPADAEAVQDLVNRSKIIINAVPAYYRSHERIFEAMAAGAVPLSFGPTDYPELNASGAIIQVDDPATTGAAVGALLADDAKLEELAKAAHGLFAANHRWTDRAPIIEDAVLGG